jgi:TniQ
MIVAQAPLQLPFAPKPFRRELFSSWLLRLADANCVTLDELLAGFQASYPSAPYAFSLDLNLDDVFLIFMARFSRVPFRTLSRLSIEKQVSNPEAALLLRFNNNSRGSRQLSRRVGYAFCPYCIARQSFVHVPWEWAFVGLLHCSVHGTPLRVGCPSSGDMDPLSFGLTPAADHVPCQSCDANLLDDPTRKGRGPSSHTVLRLKGPTGQRCSETRQIWPCFMEPAAHSSGSSSTTRSDWWSISSTNGLWHDTVSFDHPLDRHGKS